MKQEKRLYCCAFTGHRPEKLGAPEALVRRQLQIEIEQAIQDGFTTYISGMSRGVDLWAAQTVLEFRKQNPAIKLICAVPFRGFETRWGADWIRQYNEVLEKADLIRYICPRFSMQVYQIRNEWMVQHSSRLIAAYTGASGGTRNTIEYAKQRGDCEIRFLNLNQTYY